MEIGGKNFIPDNYQILKNLQESEEPLTKAMKNFYTTIRNLLLRVRSQADLKNFHENQKS
jgi:hypothetical protein